MQENLIFMLSEKQIKVLLVLFPVILDVDHPNFFEYLEVCAQANLNLTSLDNLTQPDL